MADALTVTVKDAAKRLGFPVATTERIARDLGLLIMAGNRKRIDPADLLEIMNECRSERRDRASTSARTRASGSSATPAGATAQRARETVAKLKGRSGNTSRSGSAAPAAPLSRTRSA